MDRAAFGFPTPNWVHKDGAFEGTWRQSSLRYWLHSLSHNERNQI